MSSASSVRVNITGDSRGLSRATQDAESKLSRLSRTGGRALKALGKAAAVGLAVGTAALIAFGKHAVEAASDLNEAVNKTNVVFGKSAQEVQKWSKSTAESLGISRTAALDGAASIGAMIGPLGIADKQAAKMSITMANLAGDMASFNNEDPSEMLDRIRSGLSGESEPLKRFGSNLSATRVELYAMKEGIADSYAEMTEAQKVQARYGLLLEDTAKQQGDFARTSSGLANSQRIIKAKFEDVSAAVGKSLLPMMQKVSNFIAQNLLPAFESVAVKGSKAFAGFINSFSNFAKNFADKVGKMGFGAALGDTISKAFENINWNDVGSVIGKGLKVAIGSIGGLPVTLSRIFSDAFAHINMNAVKSGLAKMGDAIKRELGISGSFGAGIGAGIADAFNSIDWSGIGEKLIEGFKVAMEGAAAIADVLSDALVAMITNLDVDAFLGAIVEFISKAIMTLTDPAFWIKHWKAVVMALFMGFVGTKLKIGGRIAEFLGKPVIEGLGLLGKLIGKFAPKLVGWIGDGLAKVFPGLAKLIPELGKKMSDLFFDFIFPKAEGIQSKVVDLIFVVVDWLKGLGPKALAALAVVGATILRGIGELVVNVVQKFLELDVKLLSAAMGAFQSIIKAIISATPKIVGFIGKLIASIVKTFWKVAKSLPKLAWSAMLGIGKAIIKWTGEGIKLIAKVGGSLLSKFWSFIKKLPGKMWDGLIGIARKVAEWDRKALNMMRDVGGHLVSGLWGAIKSLPGKVFSTMKDVSSKIWDAIKDLPSKLADLAKRAVSGFVKLFRGIGGVVGGIFRGVKSVIQTIINAIIGGLNWVIDRMNDVFRPREIDLGVKTIHTPGIQIGHIGEVQFAKGGKLDQPTLMRQPVTMLRAAEDAPVHPEYFIPTNPRYRDRAVGVLADAASALGVNVQAFANGGKYGNDIKRPKPPHSSYEFDRARLDDKLAKAGLTTTTKDDLKILEQIAKRVKKQIGFLSGAGMRYANKLSGRERRSYLKDLYSERTGLYGDLGSVRSQIADLKGGGSSGGTEDLQAQLAQSQQQTAVARQRADLLAGYIGVTGGSGDIGSGGSNALAAGGGVTIQTLHPGDPRTLAAINKATVSAFTQSTKPSPRTGNVL